MRHDACAAVPVLRLQPRPRSSRGRWTPSTCSWYAKDGACELAEALRVDPSTATRAVQRLVNDGLAERRQSTYDGRVVLVYPSAEGKLRHAAVARRRVRELCRILSAFDADERAQLAGLLGRFVNAFDERVGELAPTPRCQ